MLFSVSKRGLMLPTLATYMGSRLLAIIVTISGPSMLTSRLPNLLDVWMFGHNGSNRYSDLTSLRNSSPRLFLALFINFMTVEEFFDILGLSSREWLFLRMTQTWLFAGVVASLDLHLLVSCSLFLPGSSIFKSVGLSRVLCINITICLGLIEKTIGKTGDSRFKLWLK